MKGRRCVVANYWAVVRALKWPAERKVRRLAGSPCSKIAPAASSDRRSMRLSGLISLPAKPIFPLGQDLRRASASVLAGLIDVAAQCRRTVIT